MTGRSAFRRRLLAAGLASCVAPALAHAQIAPPPTGGGPGELPAASDRADAAPVGIRSLQLPQGETRGTDPVRVGPDLVEGRTVLARRRSEYDPVGVQVGSFRLRPSVQARAGYDGNVYAQPDGVSDAYGVLRAAASLRSEWARHAVSLDGFVNELAYASSPTEDALTYRAHALGRLDIGPRSTLGLELNQERAVVRRGATAEVLRTRRPTRYQLSSANLNFQQGLNRLQASVTGYVGRYNYENARTPDGEPLNFGYRDYDLYRAQVELGYASGAGPLLFVSATEDLRRYRVNAAPLDRNSDITELLAGVASEITPLIRGRLGIGYVRANFKDQSIKSRGSFSFDADLDYLVTELTTVTFSARRYFTNVSARNSPSGLATQVELGADHELLRNLILSASASYRRTSYVATDTHSSSYELDGGARYYLSRQLRADFVVGYRDRKGRPRPVPVDFGEVEGSVGLTFTL